MKQTFCKERHHRRSIRLPGWDYTRPGAYFVTLCTQDRTHLFGRILDGVMQLSEWGETALRCWQAIPHHFSNTALDEFVIMPNHVHGILWIVNDVGARHAVPLREQFGIPAPGSIPTVIRSYKSAVTRGINEMRGTAGAGVWQRNYWEHIIRDDVGARHAVPLESIRNYIINNPLQWHLDRENPNRTGHDDLWDRLFGNSVGKDDVHP